MSWYIHGRPEVGSGAFPPLLDFAHILLNLISFQWMAMIFSTESERERTVSFMFLTKGGKITLKIGLNY